MWYFLGATDSCKEKKSFGNETPKSLCHNF